MDARLAERFAGVIGKRLSSVECIGEGVSKQQSIAVGRHAPDLFGTPSINRPFNCTYLYLSDAEIIEEPGSRITYGDDRKNKEGRTPEWRMTYPKQSVVMNEARTGDMVWVARSATDSDEVLVVIAKQGSAYADRLDRIFGLDLRLDDSVVRGRQKFEEVDFGTPGADGLDVEDVDLLRMLGVGVDTPNELKLDTLLRELDGVRLAKGWPSTRDFSAACRRVADVAEPLADVDATLVEWFVLTNELFFLYEKHKIQPELDQEFANRPSIDVDKFFKVANSLRGRRSSRAGNTFEWHLADLMSQLGIRGDMKKTLPDGTAPDFVFPSVGLYLNRDFQDELLTVLAAKTTLKERWQQVVNEGKRHDVTFLATMDRELNASTLATMAASGVVPVTAKAHIANDYGPLADRFMSVSEFFEQVQERQKGAQDWGIVLTDLPLIVA